MHYKGLGLSLGETYFEQVKRVVLVKDRRGDYGTSIQIPAAGMDWVRREMALPEEQPHVVGGQGEAHCCRGERPLWFLPAPAQMQMQEKYEWGGMAQDAGSGVKDVPGV